MRAADHVRANADGRAGALAGRCGGSGLGVVQVLNEFTSLARRKLALSWVETEEVLQALKANLEVVPVTLNVHERAVALASAHDLNIYDASILAAAMENGCDVVVSEDMQHGQTFTGLRIENPFR